MATTVNPGSPKAVEHGCICPVIDNQHGRGSRGDGTRFITNPDCRLHHSRQSAEDIGPGWHRETFLSFWAGQQLELIVIQNGGPSENWKWTARGWRRPDEGDGADEFGWLEETSRDKAEAAAIRWYMQKDE